ncbi:MAG TPA: hypothetical protein VII92_13130, partial [Anaerolineae bacterium]
VNTTTFYLQYAPRQGSTWYTSTALSSWTASSSGDQHYTTTVPVGTRFRIVADATNTIRITPTIYLVLH